MPERPVSERAAELAAAAAQGLPVDWPAEYRALLARYDRLTRRLGKVLTIADRYQASAHDLIDRLEQAGEELRALRDLGLPVCRACGKLHGDERYLQRVQRLLAAHPTLGLVQTVCPNCLEARYGPPSPPTVKPPPAAAAAPVDATLTRVRALLATPAPAASTLTEALQALATAYERLLRRLNKLVLISDRYQAELHDSNLRLQHLASTDALTGLTSRQAMRTAIDTAVRRARMERRPLTVLALDVDHFKQVNDTHGHEAGDLVLVAVAAAILRDRRRGDHAGRWGGEEFVVLLPDCDHANGLRIAEQLRKSIAAQVVTIGEQQVSVTASIGVAVFRPDDTVNDLLRRADHALYAAKGAGRDRVMG